MGLIQSNRIYHLMHFSEGLCVDRLLVDLNQIHGLWVILGYFILKVRRTDGLLQLPAQGSKPHNCWWRPFPLKYLSVLIPKIIILFQILLSLEGLIEHHQSHIIQEFSVF